MDRNRSLLLGHRLVFVAIGLVGVLGTILAASFNYNLPSGTSVISLPHTVTSPSVTNAEELYSAFGGSANVEWVGKPATLLDRIYKWDGTSCCEANASNMSGQCIVTPAQEPNCGSPCFCIATTSGSAFFIRKSTGATVTLTGSDGSLAIPLYPTGPNSRSGTHVISLPFDTPLNDALDLIQDINSQGGAGTVLQVARWIRSLETFAGYNGTTGTTFPLIPGEGYAVTVTKQVFPYTPPFEAVVVSGRVYSDDNGNGAYDGPTLDTPFSQRNVRFDDSATGQFKIALSAADGTYSRRLGPGTWSVSVTTVPGEAWTPSPPSYNLGPIVATDPDIPNRDFVRDPVRDLSASLYLTFTQPYRSSCSSPSVPANRRTSYCATYGNPGSFDESGAQLTLTLPVAPQVNDSSLVTFTAGSCSAPTGAPVVGTGTLTWTISPFPKATQCTVCASLEVEPPQGDTLGATAEIKLAGGIPDPFPGNSSLTRQSKDVCSIDPNDLQAFPPGCGPANSLAGTETITYLTRFQNTGTAPAINVVVHNSIDPALDLSTLEIVGTSHPLTRVELTDHPQLVWTFENINLPAASSDPEGSQGYVLYSLRPRAGLAPGTKIAASAGIVFDLNDAVLTNTVTQTIAADGDGDSVLDPCDNCPEDANPNQEDVDQDGLGDACDPCSIPQPEVCDGLDNDCDAIVDEFATSCGVGECAATGVCSGGVDSCTPGTPQPELCDDLDNDCDAIVDDNLGGVAEQCNAQDENCNGLIDENNPGGGGACFIGAAFGVCRFGTLQCVSEFPGLACFPNRGPGCEICGNGLDDDCDGATDEGGDCDRDGVSNCANNCLEVSNPGQQDTNSDGVGDACQCPSPVPAVGNTVRLARGPIGDCDGNPLTPDTYCTQISWTAVPQISRYHVYRGYGVQGRSFEYNQQCMRSSTGTTAMEPLNPRRFSLFYYLVSAKCNVGASQSSLGTNSSGTPRPFALDSAGNPLMCPDPEMDLDRDSTRDAVDNCAPTPVLPGDVEYNPAQGDADTDSHGDVCDNCPEDSNPSQDDLDQDGLGDSCDPDVDGDGVFDDGDGSGTAGDHPCVGGATASCDDNCPRTSNPGQEDADNDGIGDDCEP